MKNFYTSNRPLIGIPKIYREIPKSIPEPKIELPLEPTDEEDKWILPGAKEKEKCKRRGPINRNGRH